MPLTDVSIRHSKPVDRPVKLFDGDGLFLLAMPSGARWWRFKYRLSGREKLISLGTYPDISLKLARDRRDEARRLIEAGGDPSEKRRAEKVSEANTFEGIALEWLQVQSQALDARTFKKKSRFEDFIFPYLGRSPISLIKAPELLSGR